MNTLRITAASLALLWTTAGGAVSEPHPSTTRHVAAGPVVLDESIDSDMAASGTLPLGTLAKVTNLQNGRSALVQVQDPDTRVHRRVLDVASKVADQLGMKEAGEVPVVITPIVSQPDGAVRLEVAAATRAKEAAPR
jgi:rare lipoprotein A